jgi:HD-GYP domain-containing protein (c-di-GMP phosphodiesterase class II)
MSTPSEFVTALATARRAVQLYPQTHPSFDEAIGAVTGSAAALVSVEGTFVLNLHQGHLYSGSQVISSETPGASALADSMDRHRVESLTFTPGFAGNDAIALAEVLNLRPSADLSVSDQLEARGVQSVVVGALIDESDPEVEERQRRRQADRAQYRQLVNVLHGLQDQFSSGGSPSVSQAGGMVGNIMSRLAEDESAVLGLAMMSGKTEKDLMHSVNVMIYALALGVQLGLPDEGLLALGTSALVHDVGKAVFDATDPSQSEQARILHPTVGAEILARLPDPDRTPMLVAYEHHMHVDGGGFPKRAADYIGHPYSRMIQIADRYENLTKRGDGEEGALTPDRAVVRLLQEAGKILDDLFVRLFVRALGVFPVGCVVRLSDLSVGVVAGKTDDPLAPLVMVAYAPDGSEVGDSAVVDLSLDERTLVEVVDPDSLKMDVGEHL